MRNNILNVIHLPSAVNTFAVCVVFVNAMRGLPTFVALIAINFIFGFVVGSCVGLAHTISFRRGTLLVKYIWEFMVGAISTSFILTSLGRMVEMVSDDIKFSGPTIYDLVGLIAGLITWSMIGNDPFMETSKSTMKGFSQLENLP